MSEKILLGIIILLLGGVLITGLTPKSIAPLGGVRTEFSSGNVISTSSTLVAAAGGGTLITAASSSGIWFRITNLSTSNVYCAAAATTSTLGSIPSGVHLGPLSTTSTVHHWEEWGVGGAISCNSDANALVVFSYVGK